MSREKRIYTSQTRQAQAVQTRTRILDAAKELFQSEGIESVTIEKIAQTATVSVPTVYALFKSKRGILRAIIDDALSLNQFDALVEKAAQTESLQELFVISAKIARQMYDAERVQMEEFWRTSVLTPEFKELQKENEQRRYERQRETLESVATQASLAKGMSLSRARDILWALTGRDMYRLFVVEQGWTSDEYEAWLAGSLVRMIAGDGGYV